MNPVEHIYEYIIKETEKQDIFVLRREEWRNKVLYYVTDISLWWEEIYRLREKKSEIDLLTNRTTEESLTKKMNTLLQIRKNWVVP